MNRTILHLLFLLFLTNCISLTDPHIDFQKYLESLSNKYILDKTLAVNDIFLEKRNTGLVVIGMTTSKELYDEMNQYADSLTFQYDVQLLPDTTLGDSLYGIVNVSVTPMREKPKHSSQMVDQVILGDYVKILLAIEDWYLIQTDYDYVGWISRPTIHRCGQNELSNWNKNARYRVNTLNSMIYSKPDIKSLPVSDAVLNNRLIIKRLSSKWVKAILPDGRIGYLDTSFIVPITNEIDIQKFQRLIRSTAISMKGVPYLWGGKSSKGSDCSGFTQTVFKSAGFQLPRDARQQADLGNFIIKEDLEIGDLLFFGDKERITHVGISMGGLEFIHQGIKLEGKVDLHSLDPQSPSYNEYRENSFMFAKRIRPTN